MTGAKARPELVNVSELDPTLQVRLAYASSWNFAGKQFYPVNRCLLRPVAAKALMKAQLVAIAKGFSLVLFDCYRPHSVSPHMWAAGMAHNAACRQMGKACRSTGCDPKQPHCLWEPLNHYLSRLSVHSRGVAVDVSLMRLATDGLTLEPLDMGTAYDAFTKKAWTRHISGPPLENRKLLKSILEPTGFRNYFREWWHFEFGAKNAWPVMNLSLE